MAAYCFFWRMTPGPPGVSPYWDMDQESLDAMDRFMQKRAQAQEKANRGG